MKWIKLLSIMGGLMIVFWLSGNALAFHDGGVAECSGCHTMHGYNPETGVVEGSKSKEIGFLLQATTPSDVCLNCHASVGQFDDGMGYGAAGDYYWLTRTWTWTAHNNTHNSFGYRHGHSISAPEHGIDNATEIAEGNQHAPGGNYLTANLGCNSCHDPHGSQNNELLLYGREITYLDYEFGNEAPIFFGAGRRSASSNAVSDTYASAYGTGMSLWCANCHGDIHNGGARIDMHVTEKALGMTIANNYNTYVMGVTGINGTPVNTQGFSELVQFERGPSVTEEDRNNPTGPTAASIVMCLSCHRAHATPFDNITRWDMGETFLAESHPDGATDGSTQADKDNSYYGRVWDFDAVAETGQRSLCNKCHAQDGNPLAP